jgi:hypothetical protein
VPAEPAIENARETADVRLHRTGLTVGIDCMVSIDPIATRQARSKSSCSEG